MREIAEPILFAAALAFLAFASVACNREGVRSRAAPLIIVGAAAWPALWIIMFFIAQPLAPAQSHMMYGAVALGALILSHACWSLIQLWRRNAP